MSTTEQIVREEQEQHDKQTRATRAAATAPLPEDEPDDEEPELEPAAGPVAPDPDGKKLFNEADYEREDLAIAKVDGNQIDRISLKFVGEVFLDRSDPNDVALFNRMKLGHDVTLQVEAKCSGVGAQGATDRAGDLDVVVGRRQVKVHTVYLSTADGIAKAGD